jgi:uncharacterized protein YjcR
MPVDADEIARLEARLIRTEAIILKLEDEIEKATSGAQMYQLDNGQTRQLVTKAQLTQLQNALAYFEDRRKRIKLQLESLKGGGTVVYVKPGW